MYEALDDAVSRLSENFVRTLSRREVTIRGLKGLAATLAALSLGSVINVKEAFAGCASCNWIQGKHCSSCPIGYGCNSPCSVCTTGCSGWCNYSTGYWVVPNCSCGHCNYG